MDTLEIIIYALTSLAVPLVFLIVGCTVVFKSGKILYRWNFGCKKIMARCIEIQQIREEGEVLYRPIYEYQENGYLIKASKLDYEYENNMLVGNMVPIIVETKHPDIVMEIGSQPPMASEIVKLIVGLVVIFFGLQAIIPALLFFIIGAVEL